MLDAELSEEDMQSFHESIDQSVLVNDIMTPMVFEVEPDTPLVKGGRSHGKRQDSPGSGDGRAKAERHYQCAGYSESYDRLGRRWHYHHLLRCSVSDSDDCSAIFLPHFFCFIASYRFTFTFAQDFNMFFGYTAFHQPLFNSRGAAF